MPRSAITNHELNKSSSSSTTNDNHHQQQQKRSLEDYGFLTNLKRRRHLSPQNSNIDLNNDQESISSPSNRKKTRTKSKNHSMLNSSVDSPNDHQTPRVNIHRYLSLLLLLIFFFSENIFSSYISNLVISTNA